MERHPFGTPPRARERPGASVILPDLVVGEYPEPSDAEWLRREYDVGAVVNLQDDGDLMAKGLRLRELQESYARAGIEFTRLPITDGAPEVMAARLDDAVDAVRAHVGAGRRVYLHCNAGYNRAPTVAIAFLHVHHGFSLEAAAEHVAERRLCMPFLSVLSRHYPRPGAARA